MLTDASTALMAFEFILHGARRARFILCALQKSDFVVVVCKTLGMSDLHQEYVIGSVFGVDDVDCL